MCNILTEILLIRCRWVHTVSTVLHKLILQLLHELILHCGYLTVCAGLPWFLRETQCTDWDSHSVKFTACVELFCSLFDLFQKLSMGELTMYTSSEQSCIHNAALFQLCVVGANLMNSNRSSIHRGRELRLSTLW